MFIHHKPNKIMTIITIIVIIHLIRTGCLRLSITLTVQNRDLKHHSFFIFQIFDSNDIPDVLVKTMISLADQRKYGISKIFQNRLIVIIGIKYHDEFCYELCPWCRIAIVRPVGQQSSALQLYHGYPHITNIYFKVIRLDKR